MLCWQCKCELLRDGDTGQRWTDVAAPVTQTHLTWAGDIIHMLSCTEIMLDAGVDAPMIH